MSSLIKNYEIILKNLEFTCADIKSYHQIKVPKLSNLELVALNLTWEYMSINTELQLFRCLKGSYLEPMIQQSVYNKRRKRLFNYIQAIRKCISQMFAQFTDIFVLDSLPTPICQYSRAGRSNLCATEQIKPSSGYCPSQNSRYFGYKLHAVCDKNDVFHSFDLTPAHIHRCQLFKRRKT